MNTTFMQWTYLLPILIERTNSLSEHLLNHQWFFFFSSEFPLHALLSFAVTHFLSFQLSLLFLLPLLIVFHLYFLPLRITISSPLSSSLSTSFFLTPGTLSTRMRGYLTLCSVIRCCWVSKIDSPSSAVSLMLSSSSATSSCPERLL